MIMNKIEYPVFAGVDEVYYGITENSTTKVIWYPAVEMITSNRSAVDENILKNKCTKELFAHAVSVASERIRHNPYPKLHDEEWVKKNLFIVKDFIPKYYYQTDGVTEYWYKLISDRSLTVLIDGDYAEIRHSNRKDIAKVELGLSESTHDDFHQAFYNAKSMITNLIL